MIIDFALFLAAAFFTIPLLSGYFAHTHGRSFWLWFFLGLFLPGIAHILLIVLPDKTHPLEKELNEIRIQNNLLGRRKEIPDNNLWKLKLIGGPKNEIKFDFGLSKNDEQKLIKVEIDGNRFIDLIRQVEWPQLQRLPKNTAYTSGAYEGIPVKFLRLPSSHLLGKPHMFYGDSARRSAILVCDESGLVENRAIMAKIEVFRKFVIWYDFKGQNGFQYKDIGPFVFNKLQYIHALEVLTKSVC